MWIVCFERFFLAVEIVRELRAAAFYCGVLLPTD
jgi:hypothetical protein